MSLKRMGYQPPKNREDAYKRLNQAINYTSKTGDKISASDARKIVKWLKNDDAIKQSAKVPYREEVYNQSSEVSEGPTE